MKKFLTLFLFLTMLFSMTACGTSEEEKVISHVAEYDNITLELLGEDFIKTDDGRYLIKINAVYTNNNKDSYYALSSFVVKAFLDGEKLEDVSDINGTESVLIQECKDGTSVEIHYLFDITDIAVGDEWREVEVQVFAPTAEEIMLARKHYIVSNNDENNTSSIGSDNDEENAYDKGTSENVNTNENDNVVSTEVGINIENWQEYFVIEERAEWRKNAFDEYDDVVIHHYIVLKPEWLNKIDTSKTFKVAFELNSHCAIHEFIFDPAAQTYAYGRVLDDTPADSDTTASFDNSSVFEVDGKLVAEEIIDGYNSGVGERDENGKTINDIYKYYDIDVTRVEGQIYLIEN